MADIARALIEVLTEELKSQKEQIAKLKAENEKLKLADVEKNTRMKFHSCEKNGAKASVKCDGCGKSFEL
jgi:hypothetical protein